MFGKSGDFARQFFQSVVDVLEANHQLQVGKHSYSKFNTQSGRPLLRAVARRYLVAITSRYSASQTVRFPEAWLCFAQRLSRSAAKAARPAASSFSNCNCVGPKYFRKY